MKAPSSARSGIALIIVLGFLALLTILVVAFAVMMRTERVAARSYQDVAKAKQLVYVGLSRVQDGLDDMLGGANQRIYPDWTVTNSVGAVLIDLNRTAALVSTSDSPRSLAADFIVGSALTQALVATTRAGWTNIVIDDQNNQPTLVGRVAYVVVNDSGLLDANYAGGMGRKSGVSPAELVTSNEVLTEFYNDTFAAVRSNTYKRFESIPDLTVCAQVGGCLLNGVRVSNLCVNSRAPIGFWDKWAATPAVKKPFVIGRSFSELSADRPALEQALREMFLAAGETPNVPEVAANILDYVDPRPPEEIPTWNWKSFRTKPFPMINEIVISNFSEIVSGSPSSNKFSFQPYVELYFPFVGVTNQTTYDFQLALIFLDAQPATYNPGNIPGRQGYYAATYTVTPPPGGWTQNTYVVIGPGKIPPAVGGDLVLPTSFANFRVMLVGAILKARGREIDRVGEAIPNAMPIDLSAVSTTPGTPGQQFGAACNDPRFNYESINPDPAIQAWKPIGASVSTYGPATLGSNNTSVARFAADASADGTNLMYVRNGPMTNTGELGYIVYNPARPWHTIRLYDSGLGVHPALDFFTVHTSAVLRGVANPNSLSSNVLGAICASTQTNFAPDSPGGVSLPDAMRLARGMLQAGPYERRSEIGRIPDTFWPVGSSKAQRESMISHVADLLHPRQNLFTVVVAAQAIRREPGKAYDADVDEATEVVAEQRAVAVVWRDPFPVNGSYEQKVVFFKWLTE